MDAITRLLGWECDKDMRLKILKEAKAEGVPVLEVASRYQMPEFYVITKNKDPNVIATPDGIMTIAEYGALNPYKKIVVVRRRAQ